MNLSELQDAAGPLWPAIDEALNDVRRATAAELQALHLSHAEATAALTAERDALAAEKAALLSDATTAGLTIAQLTTSLDTARADLAAATTGATAATASLASHQQIVDEIVGRAGPLLTQAIALAEPGSPLAAILAGLAQLVAAAREYVDPREIDRLQAEKAQLEAALAEKAAALERLQPTAS